MRRKDRESSRSFAEKIADTCEWAVLSMVDPEGAPYCVPLSIVRQDDLVYFHTAKQGRKLDCLRYSPRVCLACVGDTSRPPDQFTTLYESAILEGTAEEVGDEAEKIHALRLLCQRHTPANMERFDEAVARSLAVTGVWKIRVEGMTGKCKK
ncbi:MAG: 5-nitroimidazole antibiotic resistance protein [Clostridiales bacterium]|nr:5-nitroimidazole antibiotic resistance protein [Clostridiales bacterium]